MTNPTNMTPSQLRALADEIEKKNAAAVAPKELASPDFSKLKKTLAEYVAYIQSKDFCEDNDFDHYIYEAAIEAVYGKGFWTWFNARVS